MKQASKFPLPTAPGSFYLITVTERFDNKVEQAIFVGVWILLLCTCV
jgi:hypothetical protein